MKKSVVTLLLLCLLGSLAQAQTLTSLAGHQISLKQLIDQSKPLLLITWCSHCHCCRQGEKTFLLLQKQYPQINMRLLDAQWGDDSTQVQSYLKRHNLTLPVLFDPQGKFCRALGVSSNTTAMVWDHRGQMCYFGNLTALTHALKQLCLRQEVSPSSTPQKGCPIIYPDMIHHRLYPGPPHQLDQR